VTSVRLTWRFLRGWNRCVSTGGSPAPNSTLGLPVEFAPEPLQRVVVIADDALFHGDDGVVGNGDVLGADGRATFGDVAQADAVLFLEDLGAAFGVEVMQIERRVPAWAGF